jgi:hypothetical protein
VSLSEVSFRYIQIQIPRIQIEIPRIRVSSSRDAKFSVTSH